MTHRARFGEQYRRDYVTPPRAAFADHLGFEEADYVLGVTFASNPSSGDVVWLSTGRLAK